ncbi:MAG: hypothetical protein JWO86_5436 [Myxococcaceae bacterium]|nr:hypothetical protein [Myxococcaceae bacterium]MEA2751143.1 hypothetical protein [Myxococcales bacterium]
MISLNPTAGTLVLAAVLAASAIAACSLGPSDKLSAPTPPGANLASGTGTNNPPNGTTNPAADVGNVTLHRLNASEYDNTVRDLLGDTSHPSAAFTPDDGADSFTNNADALSISPVLFEQYEASAEKLATNAVANTAIMTCDGASTAADACATQILTPFLKRAWRRPVTAEEVAAVAALVQVASQEGQPFSQGMQLAIKAALLSPNFLFRVELDPNPKANTPHSLSDYELANRLSYFLWSSMPDDALFASAESGNLSKTVEELDAQVGRMLDDPKAQALLDNFAAQWLTHTLANAKPDPTLFPGFDEGLRAAMASETKAFVGSFLLGDQALPDMLDANFTFLNDRMAAQYGIPGVTGPGFVRVDVAPESHRGGLLAQASILTMTAIATRTSPVRRGEWVLAELLCSPPPPPPPNVPALPPTVSSGTMRQRMEEHRKDPACAGCHTLMDPIGFALEHYDAVGGWRDTDQGQPIDATGLIGSTHTFDGATELAQVIKNDPRFVRCATTKVFTYALGRGPKDTDTTRIDALTKGFVDGNHRTRALILDIIHNDAFRMRHGGN